MKHQQEEQSDLIPEPDDPPRRKEARKTEAVPRYEEL